MSARSRAPIAVAGSHMPSNAAICSTLRKSPKAAEVLPLLCLHGLSSGDFCPALEQFLGSTAGLSPATVTRLTAQLHIALGEPLFRWWVSRFSGDTDYVYLWVNGILLKVRLEQDKVCLLVMIEDVPSSVELRWRPA